MVSGLTAYGPGYIDAKTRDLEQIVGLQTDKPLKRAFMPYGGIKMAVESCRQAGYEPDPMLVKIFTELGVEIYGNVGDEFDPNLHNAVMHTEDETLGENVISQVFQKGFKIGDKVVRFAMVQVAN